jgi:hypothetical protein
MIDLRHSPGRRAAACKHFAAAMALASAAWAAPAHALVCAGATGYDCNLTFAQSGSIAITLLSEAGGFDHLLDLATPSSPSFSSVFAASSDPSTTTVAGRAVSAIGSTFNVATAYAAGEELVFRLSGIGTDRIGGIDPGDIGQVLAQVFTGSAAGTSTGVAGGGSFLSFVEGLGTNLITVRMADLFKADVYDPLNSGDFRNMEFSIALTPAIPEPQTYALMLAGLAALGVAARRRKAG